MRVAVFLVLAACVVANPPPPPADRFTYTINVLHAEPIDRPPASPAPIILIDGIETARVDLVYDSVVLEPHLIELRHGDHVIASTRVVAEPGGCADRVTNPTHYAKTYCGYDSGDLRFAAEEAFGDDACSGDGFCIPRCFPGDDSCPGQRCASRATLIDPFSSHLACTPIGPRLLGEACTWTDNPDGAYDDCGDGLACIAGTCHTVCRQGASTCGPCTYVPGHAPELGICD